MIFYIVSNTCDINCVVSKSYFATKKEAINYSIAMSYAPSERDIRKCIIEDNKRSIIKQFNQCAVENS